MLLPIDNVNVDLFVPYPQYILTKWYYTPRLLVCSPPIEIPAYGTGEARRHVVGQFVETVQQCFLAVGPHEDSEKAWVLGGHIPVFPTKR